MLPNGWQFIVANEHEYSTSLTIEADELLVVDYKDKQDV